jgi:uncharacterized protein YndB with AHSA1/START domain
MSQKNKLIVTTEVGKQDAILIREFDAPRELVFKLMCDGTSIDKWWGYGTEVQEYDARPGGSWRIINRVGDQEHSFRGVFHDLVMPERIVRTFEYLNIPGHVLLETTIFEDIDGRTKMTIQNLCQSVAARDGLVDSGMEQGASMSFDKLETILAASK